MPGCTQGYKNKIVVCLLLALHTYIFSIVVPPNAWLEKGREAL